MKTISGSKDNTIKGLLAVVISSIAYGVMPVFTKSILQKGLATESVVFYRFTLACLATALIMLQRGISFRVSKRQLFHLLFFGVIGFGMTGFLLADSYNYLPIGMATMFHFIYPLFVMIIMVALFKEKATPLKLVSILLMLAGLALLTNFKQSFPLKGILIAIGSGATYALYVISVERANFSSLNLSTVMFYITLFSALFFGVRVVATGEFVIPGQTTIWLSLGFISLVSTVLALHLLSLGIRLLGPTNAAILNTIEPLTSVVAGILLYQETLSSLATLGCGFIIISIFLIALDSRKLKRRSSRRGKFNF